MKYFKQMHLPKLLSVLFCLFVINNGFTQLVVNEGIDEITLIETLIGTGVEVVPESININCTLDSYGAFTGETNVGIANGLIMTTGKAEDAAGPNDDARTSSNNFGEDEDGDLEQLIPGFGIKDACIIEFDFIPKSDTLTFSFVFGSEEFSEFIDEEFNDVFGFFVSGPGIDGPFEFGGQNIAVVPDTEIPISVQTINNGPTGDYGEPMGPCTNCEYFIFNGDGKCTTGGPFQESCEDDTYIQYDGFTTVIETGIAVVPCETYHIKLAIADSGDSGVDSGVFIQGQSFSTKGIEISAGGYEDGVNFPNAAAGCTNAKLTFTNTLDIDEARTINYEIGGTAREGIDYEAIPSEVSFEAGQSQVELIFDILDDGIANEDRFLEIYFFSANCSANQFDTIRLTIEDFPVFTISEDQSICKDSTIQIIAENGFNYNWTDSSFSNPLLASQTITPQETTTYTCEIDYGRCKESLSTTVNVIDCSGAGCPNETLEITTNSLVVCSGDNVSITTILAEPELANVKWEGPAEITNGEFVATSLSCAPSVQMFTATATCLSDPSNVLTDSIEITVYPSDITQFLNINRLGCTIGVFPGRLCSPFISVSERQTFDTCSEGEAIFEVTYNMENACVETVEYAVDYNCTSPFATGNITINQPYVCNGDQPAILANGFNIGADASLYYVFHSNANLSVTGYTNNTKIYGYSLDDLIEIAQDTIPCGQEIFVTPFVIKTIEDLNNFAINEACASLGNTAAITFLCPIEIDVVNVCDFTDDTYDLSVSISGGFPGLSNNALFNVSGDVFEGMVGHTEQLQIAGLPDSTSYVINVEDEKGCMATATDTIACQNKLPIALISFSGNAMTNGNQLKWITATEINNDYFTVNSSKDGVNFEKLTLISGKGNSNTPQAYSFMDRNAAAGTTYYQLVQTDFDGTTTIAAYTEVKRGELESFNTVNLYPNPVNEQLTIQLNQLSEQPVNISLTNLQGQLILNNVYNVKQGENELTLSTLNLSKGIYVIAVDNGKTVYYQKLMKQ